MIKFIHSAWRGLCYDGNKFSTKKTAYTLSVIVTSYIVLQYQNISWELLTAYALHCTGPGTIREFLNYKFKRDVVTTDAAVDVAKEQNK